MTDDGSAKFAGVCLLDKHHGLYEFSYDELIIVSEMQNSNEYLNSDIEFDLKETKTLKKLKNGIYYVYFEGTIYFYYEDSIDGREYGYDISINYISVQNPTLEISINERLEKI